MCICGLTMLFSLHCTNIDSLMFKKLSKNKLLFFNKIDFKLDLSIMFVLYMSEKC